MSGVFESILYSKYQVILLQILWYCLEKYLAKLEQPFTVICGSLFLAVVSLWPLWTIAHQDPLSMGLFGKSTERSCHFLLQVIFPGQGSNGFLLLCRADSLQLSHLGSHMIFFKKKPESVPSYIQNNAK